MSSSATAIHIIHDGGRAGLFQKNLPLNLPQTSELSFIIYDKISLLGLNLGLKSIGTQAGVKVQPLMVNESNQTITYDIMTTKMKSMNINLLWVSKNLGVALVKFLTLGNRRR